MHATDASASASATDATDATDATKDQVSNATTCQIRGNVRNYGFVLFFSIPLKYRNDEGSAFGLNVIIHMFGAIIS